METIINNWWRKPATENTLDLENSKINISYMNNFERQVTASKDISSANQVLKVPYNMLITSDNNDPVWSNRSNKLSENERLSVILAWHKQRNNSPYSEYINVLPNSLEHLPFYWCDSAMDIIKPYPIYKEISNFKKMIKKSYSEVNTCINFTLTAADYYWARLIVSSRNFGILVNGKKVNALVPYADMLNHDFNPNTRWSFNNTSNCFEMISTSDIKKDDILTDTYGKSKSAETFLLYYGFYPESNRRNVEKIDNYTSTLDEDTTRFHQTFNKQEKLALGYLIDQKRRDVLGNRYVLQPGN